MRTWCGLLATAIALVFSVASATAQPPSPESEAAIREKLDRLNRDIEVLRQKGTDPRVLADIEVYAKAADWILRHNEFYKPNYEKDTLAALDTGLKRAAAASEGKAVWGQAPGSLILGYRSKVDESVQPYALQLPEGFDPADARRWPLYVVLHGRGGTLNEVSFIRKHDGKDVAKGQDWIQLDVFGRINNAYRWSGETDVFEAMADVQRRFRIDDRRIVLWGFSMGGAGAWHLGVHHPSKWCAAGAGAGFVDFYRYQNIKEQLPEYQHRTLRIYDAADYALNLANVPFITYGGEKDKQLAASLIMQEEAGEFDVPVELIIGKNMGHKFDDISKEKFMAFLAEHRRKGRPAFPGRREIRFTTSTLRYNECEWLTLHELDQQYEPSTVESRLDERNVLRVTTDNVTALSIARGVADRVSIDGSDPVDLNAAADSNLPDVYFVRDSDGWQVLDYDESLAFIENPEQNKRPGLQGPIDDAFMEPFVCVRGTGTAWSKPLQDWSTASLELFETEFDKWLRGKAPVIDDTQLTDELIAQKNLVLFGDPGSNAVLARVVGNLPITWTKDRIEFDGQEYDPATHAVVMIFPNPLNPERYVVINSGHTIHEKDFRASNSWLFPKLGDFAVIRFEKGDKGKPYVEEVVRAGIFNGHWELP